MPAESAPEIIRLYFSDFFEVSEAVINKYGAFNISLLSDLPLFIDPFLLFNSKKSEYQALHIEVIAYLRFLKDKSSTNQALEPGLIRALYAFPEVSQNWFGFTLVGNRGSGLGAKFANTLHQNLHRIFDDFGKESVTKGSHLEKLCLIAPGVGKDNISDFTTNLIKEYLLEYTESFTKQFIKEDLRKEFSVPRVHFNYETETWEPRTFLLPYLNSDFVLLTPKDLLAKEDTWISRHDMLSDFDMVCESVPNAQIRAQINNYFRKVLPKNATPGQKRSARADAYRKFPNLIDTYIRYKEDNGQAAVSTSSANVKVSEQLYLEQFRGLVGLLAESTAFYRLQGATYREALERAHFLKDVIENKGGHKVFYLNGKPIERESDVHILYRLTWFATPSDVSREVNDGRGPADFKISRGSADKSLVEFKLASNPHLERNLAHQTETYEKASDASQSIKVIVYFTKAELDRVLAIVERLGLAGKENIVLIDARDDNKPSGSKAS
jgi:hypothetical protein